MKLLLGGTSRWSRANLQKQLDDSGQGFRWMDLHTAARTPNPQNPAGSTKIACLASSDARPAASFLVNIIARQTVDYPQVD